MHIRANRRHALACLLAMGASCAARAAGVHANEAGALLAVLREAEGQDKPDEELQPWGWFDAVLADGRRVQIAPSWYRYLGDMQLRLVFDAGAQLESADPADLERLRLTPEDALAVAVANLRRRYGAPEVTDWGDGLLQVEGQAPELVSSYFLDRAFWSALEASHPHGLVAAVPRRAGLVFADAGDARALASLRFAAAALHAGSGGTRISSALYLFRGGHWSVWQAPSRIAAVLQ
ncbi:MULTISPECIES: hypothetical protein [Ramlibacter]|uniref:Uncharacterized protein n=1 Tax=Ramlibacter aquaticus TaxID=2780094 RepID=A0ABR9SC82_9BURK|nr:MULTISPECIES: hypothetical protein [Ramlibacter]MBE7939955.1 hypothetical protein [Ramlibacter aquaticus]